MATDPQKDWQPLGTLTELKQYGVDRKRYGSCAPYKAGAVRGCPWFDTCKIRRQAEKKGLQTPVMVGFDITTPEGDIDGKVMECWNYHQSSIHVLRGAADKNGFIVDNFKFEGDTIMAAGSRRKHIKRDPDCPACIKGDCFVMDHTPKEITIPPFPRLGTDVGSKHAMAAAKRQRLVDSLERERDLAATRKLIPDIDYDAEDEAEAVAEEEEAIEVPARGKRK